MEPFYIEIEDKRKGKKLILHSSLLYHANQKQPAVPLSSTHADFITIFRNSVREWITLVDKLTKGMPDAGIEAVTYFKLIQSFWYMAEIAQTDKIMQKVFSSCATDLILRLHQLKDYQARMPMKQKADIELMRGQVIRLMSRY